MFSGHMWLLSDSWEVSYLEEIHAEMGMGSDLGSFNVGDFILLGFISCNKCF